MSRYTLFFMLMIAVAACDTKQPTYVITEGSDSVDKQKLKDLPLPAPDSAGHVTHISTGSTTPAELITFANSLKGIPYKYGSTDPKVGFDCSGFITYVFNHFGISVPRTSVDFTYMDRSIDLKDAKTGDLILFTGTDSTTRVVGHMGIVMALPGQQVTFLHSTSGHDELGVTETPLNSYYMGRYIKTIRIFPQNDQ